MKKHLAIALTVLAFAAASAGAANARICYARSPRATGWGQSPYLSTARRIALNECAVRTPRGLVCVITSCR